MLSNKIAGYRKMLGFTQKTVAEELGISRQSYFLKEKGRIPFSDKEKIWFKKKLEILFPEITIDDIFFS
ncbi:MAG: hypothetical protein E7G01_10420 [Enterococcus faecalis]|nr:hypothetical protein [Enterococcus faecalis]